MGLNLSHYSQGWKAAPSVLFPPQTHILFFYSELKLFLCSLWNHTLHAATIPAGLKIQSHGDLMSYSSANKQSKWDLFTDVFLLKAILILVPLSAPSAARLLDSPRKHLTTALFPLLWHSQALEKKDCASSNSVFYLIKLRLIFFCAKTSGSRKNTSYYSMLCQQDPFMGWPPPSKSLRLMHFFLSKVL